MAEETLTSQCVTLCVVKCFYLMCLFLHIESVPREMLFLMLVINSAPSRRQCRVSGFYLLFYLEEESWLKSGQMFLSFFFFFLILLNVSTHLLPDCSFLLLMSDLICVPATIKKQQRTGGELQICPSVTHLHLCANDLHKILCVPGAAGG